MARHTSPNRKSIEDSYPIRVKIRVPHNGLGQSIHDITVWLKHELPDRHAKTPAIARHMQAIAVHFRTLQDAQAFIEAFPNLDLADSFEA